MGDPQARGGRGRESLGAHTLAQIQVPALQPRDAVSAVSYPLAWQCCGKVASSVCSLSCVVASGLAALHKAPLLYSIDLAAGHKVQQPSTEHAFVVSRALQCGLDANCSSRMHVSTCWT